MFHNDPSYIQSRINNRRGNEKYYQDQQTKNSRGSKKELSDTNMRENENGYDELPKENHKRQSSYEKKRQRYVQKQLGNNQNQDFSKKSLESRLYHEDDQKKILNNQDGKFSKKSLESRFFHEEEYQNQLQNENRNFSKQSLESRLFHGSDQQKGQIDNMSNIISEAGNVALSKKVQYRLELESQMKENERRRKSSLNRRRQGGGYIFDQDRHSRRDKQKNYGNELKKQIEQREKIRRNDSRTRNGNRRKGFNSYSSPGFSIGNSPQVQYNSTKHASNNQFGSFFPKLGRSNRNRNHDRNNNSKISYQMELKKQMEMNKRKREESLNRKRNPMYIPDSKYSQKYHQKHDPFSLPYERRNESPPQQISNRRRGYNNDEAYGYEEEEERDMNHHYQERNFENEPTVQRRGDSRRNRFNREGYGNGNGNDEYSNLNERKRRDYQNERGIFTNYNSNQYGRGSSKETYHHERNKYRGAVPDINSFAPAFTSNQNLGRNLGGASMGLGGLLSTKISAREKERVRRNLAYAEELRKQRDDNERRKIEKRKKNQIKAIDEERKIQAYMKMVSEREAGQNVGMKRSNILGGVKPTIEYIEQSSEKRQPTVQEQEFQHNFAGKNNDVDFSGLRVGERKAPIDAKTNVQAGISGNTRGAFRFGDPSERERRQKLAEKAKKLREDLEEQKEEKRLRKLEEKRKEEELNRKEEERIQRDIEEERMKIEEEKRKKREAIEENQKKNMEIEKMKKERVEKEKETKRLEEERKQLDLEKNKDQGNLIQGKENGFFNQNQNQFKNEEKKNVFHDRSNMFDETPPGQGGSNFLGNFQTPNRNRNMGANFGSSPNQNQNQNRMGLSPANHNMGYYSPNGNSNGGQMIPMDYLDSFKREILEIMKSQQEKEKEREDFKKQIEKYAIDLISRSAEAHKNEKQHMDELKVKLYNELNDIKKQKMKIFNDQIEKLENINKESRFQIESEDEVFSKPRRRKRRNKKKYIVGEEDMGDNLDLDLDRRNRLRQRERERKKRTVPKRYANMPPESVISMTPTNRTVDVGESIIGESRFIYPKNKNPFHTKKRKQLEREDSFNSVAESMISKASGTSMRNLQKKTDERMKRLDNILVSDSRKEQEMGDYLDNISTITEAVNNDNRSARSTITDIGASVSQIGEL